MALSVPQRGLVTSQGFQPVQPKHYMVDPKVEAAKEFKRLGSFLDGVEIAYNDILVAKYVPSMIGSLIAAEKTQQEQRWQGKCGLVLKFGPTAADDGFKYEVGDWVYYRSSDGSEIGIKCENDPQIMMCLILSPAHVIGRVSNPDLLW